MNLVQSSKFKIQSLFFILILLSTIYRLPSTYQAEAAPVVVSSEELLRDAQAYDGKIVIYKGEVIGDVMIRQEYAWINVRDETSSIGIFCPKELVSQIEHQGSYGFSGDIISLRGTFHASCPEHGGDTDIHAQKLTIVRKGEAISYPQEAGKVRASIILSAIAFALAIVHLVVRRFR